MDDFDKHWQAMNSEFDKAWKRQSIAAWLGTAVILIIKLGSLAFIGWVIVKIMLFYGVI